MKQHLSIKKFYGNSEQAVHNQVYIAVIVYYLNVHSLIHEVTEVTCKLVDI